MPETFTTCGPLGSLSVIVTVPVRRPVAVGVNVTNTLQVSRLSTPPLGQSLVLAKSPVTVTLETFNFELPKLVIVMCDWGLVVFTCCKGKESVVGEATGHVRGVST